MIVCVAVDVVVRTHAICNRFQRAAWKTAIYNQLILLKISVSGSHTDSLPSFYLQRHSNFDTPVTYVSYLSVVSEDVLGIILLRSAWIV